MHNLLGYRFDHLLLENIPKPAAPNSLCQMLSIRMAVDDISAEKAFFRQILDIVPLVENEYQVLLPLSQALTLNLLSRNGPNIESADSGALPFATIELDFLSENIRTTLDLIRQISGNPEESLTMAGSRQMTKITSPSGITLRFWE